MKISITLLLITIISQLTFGQIKSFDKKLTDKINLNDSLIISVEHNSEMYKRWEINVVYKQGSILKMHSILKSNYSEDKQIDTVFILNEKQIKLLNNFEVNFKKNEIPTGLIIAGTFTTYRISINGNYTSLQNKSDYSLTTDLLKE